MFLFPMTRQVGLANRDNNLNLVKHPGVASAVRKCYDVIWLLEV